jgi:multidrug efflux pump subunit AcrB
MPLTGGIMITILIVGLLLFIAGVGATYIHDAHKAHMAKVKDTNEFMANSKPPPPTALDKAQKQAAAAQKKLQDMLSGSNPVWKSTTKTRTTTTPNKRVIKPGSVKTGFHKPGQVPTETQETMSLEELIKHIESLKKK